MAFNIKHTSQVYFDITSLAGQDDRIYSYLVMIVIDLAVIVFVILGKKEESETFAWFLFWLNLIFFDVLTDGFNIYERWRTGDYRGMIPYVNTFIAKSSFSYIFAYSIHRFSVLFSDHFGTSAGVEQLGAENKHLKAQLEQTIAQSEQVKAELREEKITIQQITGKLEGVESVIEAVKSNFTCPHCKDFSPDLLQDPNSILKSLRAHIGSCSKKAESEHKEAFLINN